MLLQENKKYFQRDLEAAHTDSSLVLNPIHHILLCVSQDTRALVCLMPRMRREGKKQPHCALCPTGLQSTVHSTAELSLQLSELNNSTLGASIHFSWCRRRHCSCYHVLSPPITRKGIYTFSPPSLSPVFSFLLTQLCQN